jgi:hypothetical protein
MVQVDPMKLMLRALGLKCLILIYNESPSYFDFSFNLHHYTVAAVPANAEAEELAVIAKDNDNPPPSEDVTRLRRAVQVDSIETRLERARGFSA